MKKKSPKRKTRTAKKKSIIKSPVKKQRKVEAKPMRKRKRSRVAKAITRATRTAAVKTKRVARRIGGNKADMKSIAIASGLGVVGAIISSFIANKLPLKDNRIKSAIPLIAGIGASMTKMGSNKMIQPLLAGAIISGGVSMVRQFVPGLAMLAGEDEEYPDTIMGGIEDFSGVTEIGYNNIDSDSETDNFGEEIDEIGSDEIWATNNDI